MKHLLTSALALGVFALAPAADAQEIIMVTHGQANDPFWSVVKNGVDAAAEDTGADVTYRAPDSFDMVEMSQMIDAAVNQEPDGLAVSIPDAEALRDSIMRAKQAGIPVISLNSGPEASDEMGLALHVGQRPFDAGKRAGKELAELGGTKGICVNHEVGNVALDRRCEGFEEGFGKPVEVLPTSNEPSEVQSAVTGALQSDQEIDTILALGAPTSGEPSVAAVKELGRSDDILVASFDLSANFLKSVANGDAAFALDQQQWLQGYLPIVFLAKNAKYGVMPASDVASGPNLVTQDKAQQVIDLAAEGIR